MRLLTVTMVTTSESDGLVPSSKAALAADTNPSTTRMLTTPGDPSSIDIATPRMGREELADTKDPLRTENATAADGAFAALDITIADKTAGPAPISVQSAVTLLFPVTTTSIARSVGGPNASRRHTTDDALHADVVVDDIALSSATVT